MPGERVADLRDKANRTSPASDEGLDAELDRAVGSMEPIAYVIVFVGDQPGRVYTLNHDTVLVGRADDADIHIGDPSVSARHAQILSGGHGFEIEDLDSTNGTFVGGQKVRRAPLRNGDRVAVGSVEFLFLVDRPVDATIAIIPPPGRRAAPAAPPLAIATAVPVSAPAQAPVAPRAPRGDDDEEAGPSLADIIRKVAAAYRFVRRHTLLIVLLAAVGNLVGLSSILVLPPRSSAVCDVKLVPKVKSNPVDPQFRSQSDDDDLQFFQGAERAFAQPDLVRATLHALGAGEGPGGEPTDSQVASVANRLRLEPVVEHLFRATYEDKRFHHEKTPLVKTLSTHLQNYVRSEIDKSLREFNAKAEFLRDQLRGVEKELAAVDEEKTRFREANADSLPEDAAQTHSSRFTLLTRQTDAQATIRRLEGELDAERRQLDAETPIAQARFQSAQVYRDTLADLNRKLSEAYARGLADGHPEVQRLKGEKERIDGIIAADMRANTSSIERTSNVNLQALRSRVEMLQAQLKAARTDLGETQRSLGQIRTVVGNQPRVEQRLVDLNREQEATTRLHGQLFEKLKQAELQLNLEHVSAESRYEISPPRLERPSTSSTLAMRCGLGILAGLLVAAGIVAAGEGRRLIAEALAAPADAAAQSPPAAQPRT
jgi:prefoldin subunit 5